MMLPKNLNAIYQRSKHLRATVLNAHTVIVASESAPTANQIVTLEYLPDGVIHARCTCPWSQYGGVACSHVLAALEQLAAVKGRVLSFWRSYEQARRQKRRLFCLRGARQEGVWITSRPKPRGEPGDPKRRTA